MHYDNIRHNILIILFVVAAHLMAGTLFQAVTYTSNKKNQKDQLKTIELEHFDQKELLRLRQKGVENSEEKNFSEAAYIPKETPKLSFSNLGIPKKNTAKVEKEKDERGLETLETSNQITVNQFNLNSDLIKNVSATPQEKYFLENAEFQFSFTPPKGVSEDKLNPLEKKFYSFQRRSYQTYVTSFIQTYGSAKRAKPYITKKLTDANYTIRGRVQFDLDGNIEAIQILNPAGDNDITDLFRQTLENMVALKNPPKELLDQNGFVIFFSLVFSN